MADLDQNPMILPSQQLLNISQRSPSEKHIFFPQEYEEEFEDYSGSEARMDGFSRPQCTVVEALSL